MDYAYCSQPVRVTIGNTPRVGVSLGNITVGSEVPAYSGTHEVTPTQERQVLPTAGTQLKRDIVVEPIPENYGLITWNGSFIRVS